MTPLDLAAHDIARRELGKRVDVQHEALHVAVEQVRALTSERLADKEPRRRLVIQGRRVELHELHVRDLSTRAPRGSNPVAGRHGRIGGDAKDLARSAGRQHDGVGEVRLEFARRRVHQKRPDAASLSGEQVDEEPVLEHGNAGSAEERFGERALDGGSGLVPRVQDPRKRVAALARERYAAFFGQVEAHAEPLERLKCLGCFADHRSHDRLVAQSLPDDERVGHVQLDRVGLAHRPGDAALRVPRGACRPDGPL